MKESHRLNGMLANFMESDAGKLLVLKLGEEKKYIRLAVGESCMSLTPTYFIDGGGLRVSVENSAMMAALTRTKQEVSKPVPCPLNDVVEAIEHDGSFCCPEAFMYWLEKCTVEKDGNLLPDSVLAAA